MELIFNIQWQYLVISILQSSLLILFLVYINQPSWPIAEACGAPESPVKGQEMLVHHASHTHTCNQWERDRERERIVLCGHVHMYMAAQDDTSGGHPGTSLCATCVWSIFGACGPYSFNHHSPILTRTVWLWKTWESERPVFVTSPQIGHSPWPLEHIHLQTNPSDCWFNHL